MSCGFFLCKYVFPSQEVRVCDLGGIPLPQFCCTCTRPRLCTFCFSFMWTMDLHDSTEMGKVPFQSKKAWKQVVQTVGECVVGTKVAYEQQFVAWHCWVKLYRDLTQESCPSTCDCHCLPCAQLVWVPRQNQCCSATRLGLGLGHPSRARAWREFLVASLLLLRHANPIFPRTPVPHLFRRASSPKA